MKNYFISLLLTLLLIISSLISSSQINLGNWQLGAHVGFVAYQGDLTPIFLGSYKNIKPTIGINISRILSPSLRLRTVVSLGKIIGDESIYPVPAFRRLRNLSFSTPFIEISEVLVWNYLDHYDDIYYKKISPYIFSGIGVSFLNISRSSANVSPIYLANEREFALGLLQDLQTTPPKFVLVLPIGIGVEYYLSQAASVNFEINFRFTTTDYLDGFSKVANLKSNDYYYTAAIGIIYRFNKKGTLGCPDLKYKNSFY